MNGMDGFVTTARLRPGPWRKLGYVQLIVIHFAQSRLGCNDHCGMGSMWLLRNHGGHIVHISIAPKDMCSSGINPESGHVLLA